MSNPTVSIIVPVYNAEKYLERCIDSLKKQSLENIEIILVNDESSDSSPDICDKAANEDSRIKVIHKKNGGAGMARNSALEIATGKYIGFVDSDDYVEPEMFKTLCDRALKYESDLVMSGVLIVDGNMFSEAGECVRKTYFDSDTHFETEKDLQKLRMGIIGSLPGDAEDSKYGMSIWKNLFRNEIIRKNNIKFLSEKEIYSEDALFMIDYITCINKATGISEAFYNYCRNGESISKSYKKDRFEKSLIFVSELEKRFKPDISVDEYSLYTDRFWQAMCRVLCSQEIMYSEDNGIEYSVMKRRLEEILSHPQSETVFKRYPLRKLPFKQALFAYAMKYKLYPVLKKMVNLRSR